MQPAHHTGAADAADREAPEESATTVIAETAESRMSATNGNQAGRRVD